MRAMRMLAAAMKGDLPGLMFTSALLMALRPHLGEFAPDKMVEFNMRGDKNGDKVGILVRALVPDVDALKES